MTNSLKKFGNTLTKIAGLVGVAFGAAALINFGKEAIKAASALNDAWMGLESIVTAQGKSFSEAKSFINDYISDGLVPLENAVTAYKNLAARGYSSDQIEKTMVALKDAAAFGRQASYSLGDAVSSATEGLKNENSILVDNAGVTKNVAKMWDDYAKSIGTTANNLTKDQKIQAEVNGILEETRFQTGDAAKLVTTYSGQIALLGFNFQKLKVEVGNALIPIAQAVLPGINAIIAGLTKLAGVFSKVTALLFGKSANVKETGGIAASASSASGATDELADSLGGAGDAAKKAGKDMKSVTAPFDEFNILADNTASSLEDAAAGMGTSVPEMEIPSYESEIEEADQLGEAFSSLGELFVKTLDDILAAMPGFRENLLGFADSFNEFNQKLYDAFTFPGLKDRVQQLGVELAKAFNDLVVAIDWELWGKKLGAGLNLGLQFLVNLLYTFDWIGFGNKLAEFINGAVSEIDWAAVGQLLFLKFKLALEIMSGLILNLDMAQLGQAASNIIIGFFNSMEETIRKIDWYKIGAQIAEFLNNIDWAGVISAVAGAIKEAVPAILEAISGFIANADPDTLLVAAAFLASKLLGGLITKVLLPLGKEIVSKLIGNLVSEISGSGIGAFLSKIGGVIAKIAPVFGGIATLISGIVLAVTNFFSMLAGGFDWLKEILMIVGAAFAAVGAVILGAPALVAAAVAGIVAAVMTAIVVIKENWDAIAKFFSQLWENIKNWAIDTWNGIRDYWSGVGEWWNENVIQPVTQFFSDMWNAITQFASDTWAGIQDVWSAVSTWFSETIIEPLKTFFSDFWENIKQFASDAWTNIQTVWSVVCSWFNENIIEPVKKFFSDMWENVKQLASDAWAGIQQIWSVVTGWFDTNIIKPVTGFFSGMWNGIKDGASALWSNIVSVWQSAGEWFRAHVAEPIGNAFEAAGNFIKGIFNGVIGGVEWLINSAIRGVNWLISQLNKISFNVPDWVPGIGGKDFGFNIRPVSEVSLPRLANGAVIPPNQQFAAILGDQRSGKNIEAPIALIRQAVTEGIQAAGGSGSNQPIQVNVILERKVLATAIVNEINRMTRSGGRSPLLM
ncbi:hypothetical protein [Pseudoflavonifractor sp. 524-17]|uniref:hypothetical protein n=1 Tax=Pseudoflavonifractor sp. 524-17 TaxID=2304577 RepID=UPI00137A9EC1|nr:hypothetical protein [Pseudoflavonifractor sp. 524-17]